MTAADIKDERTGNAGRMEWNKRPQTAEEAQAMLTGATNTITRLLNEIEGLTKDIDMEYARIEKTIDAFNAVYDHTNPRDVAIGEALESGGLYIGLIEDDGKSQV